MTHPATDRVILIDIQDRETGTAEKLAAHVEGQLHRAFSIFVFNETGRILLQRRAEGKYHSAGLWSNSCCGHPRPGEEITEAAARRLYEEMGFSCALAHVGSFIYRAPLSNGLIEHELDHVFVGRFAGLPTPDEAEVAAWRWIDRGELEAAMRTAPATFTAWLAPALECLGSSEPRVE